ncbi:phage/plasmid primase, P4 family [Rosistilla oblonga]|uniref:phage/plasmid primase, P4 family n=1 Tax=Rosistilla oblonga TaxID=2527990 RepID=UPI003A985C22
MKTLSTDAPKKSTKHPIGTQPITTAKELIRGRESELCEAFGVNFGELTSERRTLCRCGKRKLKTSNTSTGSGGCDGCGGTYGDWVGFVAYTKGLSDLDAAKAIIDRLGDGRKPKPKLKPQPIAQKSDDAATFPAADDDATDTDTGPANEQETEVRHRVYTSLLAAMQLRDEHRDDLRRRGLDDAAIDRGEYRSWPPTVPVAASIYRDTLRDQLSDDELDQVPGIWVGRLAKTIICAGPHGYLIPARNEAGKIRGCQIRLDHPIEETKYVWLSSRSGGQPNRPSPGTPAHCSAGTSPGCEILRLTEGPLKADISEHLSGIPTVAVAGVALWERFLPIVEELQPEEVRVSFDADAKTNPAVAKNLRKLVAALQAADANVAIETWDATVGKGIDDLLAAGGKLTVLSEPSEIKIYLAGLAGGDSDTGAQPDDPFRLAEINLQKYRGKGRDICNWRGDWYTWKRSHWEKQSVEYLRSRVRETIEEEFVSLYREEKERHEAAGEEGRKPPKKRKVTGVMVRDTLDAMQSLTIVQDHIEMGCRRSDRSRPNIWPVRNGLLDLELLQTDYDNCLIDHTPDWFVDFSHDYRFDLESDCPTWLGFLDEVFGNPATGTVDTESIDTLQRWFGYCLMPHARLHKMLVLDGVSRSGKGVITRVLKAIVGDRYTCSPRLRDFAGDFGLAPLVGKRLAVIGDAKLDRYRHDTESILEVLLGIVGEDSQDVNAKRRDVATSIKLPVKFCLACNGLPSLNDPAMAIVNRVVILKFSRSFAGREDTGLTERLLAELDGIFMWSLLGYRNMAENLALPQPESGRQSLDNFRRAVAPIRGFVEECCIVTSADDPNDLSQSDYRDRVYAAYRGWCEAAGRDRPGTRASFIRQLLEAYPHIEQSRPQEGDKRPYKLLNIGLNASGREYGTEWGAKQDGDSESESDARNF